MPWGHRAIGPGPLIGKTPFIPFFGIDTIVLTFSIFDSGHLSVLYVPSFWFSFGIMSLCCFSIVSLTDDRLINKQERFERKLLN